MWKRSVAVLVLAGAIAMASISALACSKFSADEPAASDGAVSGMDGPGPGADGAVPDHDGSTVDAAPSTAVDAGTCFDFAAGDQGFTAVMTGGATATARPDAGLALTYPPLGTDQLADARWLKELEAPPGATGAIVTVDAIIDTPPLGRTQDWYAGFAGLANGPAAEGDTSPIVVMVLANQTTSTMSLDLDIFPAGAQGGAKAATATSFATLMTGPQQSVHAVLDVTWSQKAGDVNAHASLPASMSPPTFPPAATLSRPSQAKWTLQLGGTAMADPNVGILYTKACVEMR